MTGCAACPARTRVRVRVQLDREAEWTPEGSRDATLIGFEVTAYHIYGGQRRLETHDGRAFFSAEELE